MTMRAERPAALAPAHELTTLGNETIAGGGYRPRMTDRTLANSRLHADLSAAELLHGHGRAICIPAWLGLIATGVLGWSLVLLAI